MKKRKVLSLLLTLALCGGLLTVPTHAAVTLNVLNTDGMSLAYAQAALDKVEKAIYDTAHPTAHPDDIINHTTFLGGYLVDVTQDGVPELILQIISGHEESATVYQWNGTALEEIAEAYESHGHVTGCSYAIRQWEGQFYMDMLMGYFGGPSISFSRSVTTFDDTKILDVEYTNASNAEKQAISNWNAAPGYMLIGSTYSGDISAEWNSQLVQRGESPEALQSALQQRVAQGDAPASIAYPSTQTVDVDGSPVEFQMYALKDEAGNLTNYVKLRDVASVLNGTDAQFRVGWDGSVNIEPGKSYTPNGSEMNTPFSGERSYTEPTATTKIDGRTAELAAIVLTDDQGGGFTYYQLRDLGKALGFNVGWSADRGVFLEAGKPYDPNN